MFRPRVFLADDHEVLLDAFRSYLESECEIVGTARDGGELLDQAPLARPDVVVVDISMPNLNGIDAAEALRKKLPGVKIIFLTVSEDPALALKAIDAGCSGYLLKKGGGKELLQAIHLAARGRRYITPGIEAAVAARFGKDGDRIGEITQRQRQVLQLLAGGRSMKQAASALGITQRTVAHHKYTMMQSLGIESTAELIRYGLQNGLVE